MKIIGYIWNVFTNTITVFVVIAIFAISNTKFESVVIAALVLIYLSIVGFGKIWALNHLELTEALGDELTKIKMMIREPLLEDEALEKEIYAFDLEAKKERADKKRAVMIKFYISSAFLTLIYVIALCNLFIALSGS